MSLGDSIVYTRTCPLLDLSRSAAVKCIPIYRDHPSTHHHHHRNWNKFRSARSSVLVRLCSSIFSFALHVIIPGWPSKTAKSVADIFAGKVIACGANSQSVGGERRERIVQTEKSYF